MKNARMLKFVRWMSMRIWDLRNRIKLSQSRFLILFRDGEVQEKLTGLQSKKDLMDMIKKYKA